MCHTSINSNTCDASLSTLHVVFISGIIHNKHQWFIHSNNPKRILFSNWIVDYCLNECNIMQGVKRNNPYKYTRYMYGHGGITRHTTELNIIEVATQMRWRATTKIIDNKQKKISFFFAHRTTNQAIMFFFYLVFYQSDTTE